MAAGRGRARTVETDRAAETHTTGPVATPSAPGWELDEAEPAGSGGRSSDSWEPVVPDTWDVPPDRLEPAEDEGAPSAGWSDAARAEEEWVDAARHDGSPMDDAVRVPYLESVAAQYLGDEPVPVGRPRRLTTEEAPGEQGSNAARMALGLATLAAQRLRGGVPVGDGFVMGVGLAQETANGLRELGRRVLGPASRVVAGAAKGAAMLPIAGIPVRVALLARERLAAAAEGLRARGHETVEVGRADAERVLRQRFDLALRWASDHAVTPLVEQLAPRVAEHVLPRVIDDVAGKVTGSATSDGRRRR